MAQVHPYKFTTAILSLAEQSGVQLITGLCTSLNANSVTYTKESTSYDLPSDTIVVAASPFSSSRDTNIKLSRTFYSHRTDFSPPTRGNVLFV
jgi:glycine/D-amino acid oxidase-like deaminating enzyme